MGRCFPGFGFDVDTNETVASVIRFAAVKCKLETWKETLSYTEEPLGEIAWFENTGSGLGLGKASIAKEISTRTCEYLKAVVCVLVQVDQHRVFDLKFNSEVLMEDHLQG